MAANKPLTGIELIDCAKANSQELVDIVASRCGYGENVSLFEQELKKSCQEIGIDLDSFYDLKQIEQQRFLKTKKAGVEIAPDTYREL
ncbi:hypothetical protein [Calothrix sp. NIES-3974]|uniref:hypothetical protein n=1 Tax=Calothrix sp. NIES-3974 TaxID=2005462 RepID=UPI000B5FB35E|nr:hypothetical protein [Calothrix sp. NIES-3974]BAZ07880.1 hypothetical protein NIES3974_45450 [Calothrix sp. NIES-3974]